MLKLESGIASTLEFEMPVHNYFQNQSFQFKLELLLPANPVPGGRGVRRGYHGLGHEVGSRFERHVRLQATAWRKKYKRAPTTTDPTAGPPSAWSEK